MKAYFIAEIGSNWYVEGNNQDWDRMNALINEAKYCGFDAIKLQLFKSDKLYAPEMTKQIKSMKERELPQSWIPKIALACDLLNLDFICTPFDLDAVDTLRPFVSAYKIASYEALDFQLIETCTYTGKPVFISTGLISSEGLKLLIHQFSKYKRIAGYPIHEYANFKFLHCVSKYPTDINECDLQRIKEWSKIPGVGQMGWSDHTVNKQAILGAVVCGADTIEMHFDLNDMRGCESSLGHVWDSHKAKDIIQQVREIELGINSFPIDISEESKWMTDPIDHLRPLKHFRKELKNNA